MSSEFILQNINNHRHKSNLQMKLRFPFCDSLSFKSLLNSQLYKLFKAIICLFTSPADYFQIYYMFAAFQVYIEYPCGVAIKHCEKIEK